jgi:hypothetical protein
MLDMVQESNDKKEKMKIKLSLPAQDELLKLHNGFYNCR